MIVRTEQHTNGTYSASVQFAVRGKFTVICEFRAHSAAVLIARVSGFIQEYVIDRAPLTYSLDAMDVYGMMINDSMDQRPGAAWYAEGKRYTAFFRAHAPVSSYDVCTPIVCHTIEREII